MFMELATPAKEVRFSAALVCLLAELRKNYVVYVFSGANVRARCAFLSCSHALLLHLLEVFNEQTSCARGDTICPAPLPLSRGRPAPRAPPSRRNAAVLPTPNKFPR